MVQLLPVLLLALAVEANTLGRQKARPRPGRLRMEAKYTTRAQKQAIAFSAVLGVILLICEAVGLFSLWLGRVVIPGFEFLAIVGTICAFGWIALTGFVAVAFSFGGELPDAEA